MPKLNLSGVIGDEIQPGPVKAFLEANAGVGVDMDLSSFGGSVFAGMELATAIRDHGNVSVRVTALAASAATLLLAAAKHATMAPSSLLMLHRASSMTLGTAAIHRKSAEVLDTIDAQVLDLYTAAICSRGKTISPQRLAALLDSEWWLTGEEAVSNGLADTAEAASSDPDAPVRASMNFKFDDIRNIYRHPPQALFALMANCESHTMPNPNPVVSAGNARAIFDLCNVAHLTMEETASVIEKADADLNKAKDIVIDMVAKKAGDQRVIPGNGDGLGNPNTLATAIGDVLYARMSNQPVKAGTPAEDLSGRSLLDLGAMLLQARGEKVRSWHKDRLATQVLMEGGRHSTSDFPFLTQQSGQRILLDAYTAAASPLKQIARQRSANDFRGLAVGRIGEMPELKEVKEGGEVTYGSRTEASEAFRVRTFARIFSITREAIINDDLSAFADSARAWGIAASTVEANELYALIADDGVVMQDGLPLWNSVHGNLAEAPSALDLDGLSDGRLAIRNTRGIDGVTPLSIPPKYLIVGPANETQAEKVLTAIAAARVEDANVFSGGKLTLLVEPRITDFAWYLAADPSQAEALSYAYLGGNSGPDLQSRDGWTTLGVEMRAVHDFGAGATGFRGVFKNAGADPAED
ncbi:MAG TPA: ATP-dependent Clp protease proteolytic subunit [Bauldia sp.]|nr:ATP-dependent Clp protease proteolytic subunit [Bauldia sp.]